MTNATTAHETGSSAPAAEADTRRPFVPPVVENLGGLQTVTLLT